ncbi:MAG: uncharacterized protein QOE90_1556 [Thermoplasmata archaeon]|jgi:uncharacterized protein (DUF1684 family)|nr:uncharacterized protein [Thermoplasmata archaeon]
MDYVAQVLAQRKAKDEAFRTQPWSPIPRHERAAFAGLRYFDPDLAWRIAAAWEPAAVPKPLKVQTSTGEVRDYLDVGTLRMKTPAGEVALHAYAGGGGELFVPFRDATSAKETYGAGRYLDVEMPHGASAVVDFNLAYSPYCAYSEDFSCPFPPPENWLKVPIRAGEKSYHE